MKRGGIFGGVWPQRTDVDCAQAFWERRLLREEGLGGCVLRGDGSRPVPFSVLCGFTRNERRGLQETSSQTTDPRELSCCLFVFYRIKQQPPQRDFALRGPPRRAAVAGALLASEPPSGRREAGAEPRGGGGGGGGGAGPRGRAPMRRLRGGARRAQAQARRGGRRGPGSGSSSRRAPWGVSAAGALAVP